MRQISILGFGLFCSMLLSACASATNGPPKTCRLGEPFVQPEYKPNTGPFELSTTPTRSYVPSSALRSAKRNQ